MNDMEKAILDMIEKYYKCKYIGGLKVVKTGPDWSGYKLIMDLGNPDGASISISADLEAEDFLKFVKQELISRQLHKVQFFKGVKKYIGDDQRGTCQKN